MKFFLLSITFVGAIEECSNICSSLAINPCGKNSSYCTRGGNVCYDLFWLNREEGTMCSHATKGCPKKEHVKCSEAQVMTFPAGKAVVAPNCAPDWGSGNRGMRKVDSHISAAVQALIHIPIIRERVYSRNTVSEYATVVSVWNQLRDIVDASPINLRPLARELGLNPKASGDPADVLRSISALPIFALPYQPGRPPCPHCQAPSRSRDVLIGLHSIRIKNPLATKPVSFLDAGDLIDLSCESCGGQTRDHRGDHGHFRVFVLERFHGDALVTPVTIPLKFEQERVGGAYYDYRQDIIVEYQLKSIVHYMGEHHYETEYYNNGVWFRANGAHVTPVAEPVLAGSTPYMMVYGRVYVPMPFPWNV